MIGGFAMNHSLENAQTLIAIVFIVYGTIKYKMGRYRKNRLREIKGLGEL